MANQNEYDLKFILKTFTQPDFLDLTMLKFDKVFNNMSFVDQFVFSQYNKFMDDVKMFKISLLKFILEAQIHLLALKDNMKTTKFQKLNEEQQLKFIEGRLSRINKDVLFDHLLACQKLIATSIILYDKYGTTWFKIKFLIFNLLGFAAVGAATALVVGMALPFLSIIEATVGGIVGAVGGLAYAVYQLIVKWDEKMEKIEKVRDHLKRIHERLVDLESQLQATYQEVGKSQLELNNKIKGESMFEVIDLQQYIDTTYVRFIELEKTLSSTEIKEKKC